MTSRAANESPAFSETITCVVADDHPALRQALTRILVAEGIEVVRDVSDGAETFAAVEELQPTVAILDLVLRPDDAIDLLRRSAGASPQTAIILYTSRAESELLVQALEAGARGFVLKEAPIDELVRAVTIVAGGKVYVDPALGAELIRRDRRRKGSALSARERDILHLLGDGKTSKEIAETLFLSPDTVRTYVRRAMEKLEAATRTHAVAIAIRRSLIP